MFAKRLISSLVLWSLLLGVLFYLPLSRVGYLATCLFCCFVVTIALDEFYDILAKGGQHCLKRWGLVGGLLLIAGTWWCTANRPVFTCTFEILFVVALVLVLFLRQLADSGNSNGTQTIGNTLLGILYVALMFGFIPKIIFLFGEEKAAFGRLFVFYLVITTKFCDIGAYASGTVFGRHKMIPRISPNKTWEGFFGGLMVAVVASVCCYQYLSDRIVLLGFTFLDAVVLGILLGGVGALGDLAESMVKREMQVKDSGGVLPGIGGALDLIDSLLFTTPVLYAYLALRLV
jgi:phosphatidate cytidylyltransferase